MGVSGVPPSNGTADGADATVADVVGAKWRATTESRTWPVDKHEKKETRVSEKTKKEK